jgi:glutathione S-transferase
VKPILYVGNRNYSSWSLRPWLVLSWAGIEFETHALPLGGPGYMQRRVPRVLAINPSGTVPALHVGDDIIADSLAISEWAAEQKPGLWPSDPAARAQARSAACEMHSSFAALRSSLPCNIRRRAEPRQHGEDVLREIERVEQIWKTLAERFGNGGPYLFGAKPTITDAFYTPVATRFRTYGVKLSDGAQKYSSALLDNPAFLAWERDAKVEEWTMPEWDDV